MSYQYENPQQKQNRKEFNAFAKALTGSVASRLARRDQKASMSSLRTDKYMREADVYIKKNNAKVVARQAPLPPRFHTLLALQMVGGEEKGQWHKSPEMVQLLGGFIPDPPNGIEEWRWWTALGMAFIRRHPHLWKLTRAAYERAEFWVSDIWLLRTARDMLPPLDGTFKDFVGRQSTDEMSSDIVNQIRAGQWRQPVTGALENRGYMAFTWDMKGRTIRDTNTLAEAAPGESEHGKGAGHGRTDDAMEGRGREQGASPHSPPGERSFTAEAAANMEATIKAQGRKLGRSWKTDDEINELARKKDRQVKRERVWSQQSKALNMEFQQYLSKPGKAFQMNDPVTTRWRASSDFDRPRVHKQWWSAKVMKIYSDGSVDVTIADDRGETYKRVHPNHVRIDRVALAILSAKQGQSGGDDEPFDLYQARKDRGGGPARRHAGIDALCEKWSKPMSQQKETQRLAPYLADRRPEFSTRSCRLKNAGTMQLRRPDQTLLDTLSSNGKGGGSTPKEIRDQRRKKAMLERAKRTPTLDELMREEHDNALTAELRAMAPVGVADTRVSVGSVRGEVAQRQAMEKQRKAMLKRKKIMKAVVDSEETLALTMLKYEEQLEQVQQALLNAIDMHKTAALQTEQIHAFDPVTACLNETRWITCELVEAISDWRISKENMGLMDPSLLGPAYAVMKAIEQDYDPLEDDDNDEMGLLHSPGAMPFLWGGNNALLKILTGLNFLASSHELREWYGGNFSLLNNPFMLVTPIENRAHTPRKFTQTVMVDGEEVEHEVPRLKALAGKAVKKLKVVKDKQFNCSFWWPGHNMRAPEFERARRAEKEIVQELRREKLRNVRSQKDAKAAYEKQQNELAQANMF